MKKVMLMVSLVFFVFNAEAKLFNDSPFPFPLKVEVLLKNQKVWLHSEDRLFSIKIEKSKNSSFNYTLVDWTSGEIVRGHMVPVKNQLCGMPEGGLVCISTNQEEIMVSIINATGEYESFFETRPEELN